MVTTINKSAEHLLKINPGKVLGRNFRDVLREKHLEIVKEVVRDLMLSRQDTVTGRSSWTSRAPVWRCIFTLPCCAMSRGMYWGRCWCWTT